MYLNIETNDRAMSRREVKGIEMDGNARAESNYILVRPSVLEGPERLPGHFEGIKKRWDSRETIPPFNMVSI